MQYTCKNNDLFMEELDEFNKQYEEYKRRCRLLIDELPSTKYDYKGKTISEFPIKSKQRKVFVYKKDEDGKLF